MGHRRPIALLKYDRKSIRMLWEPFLTQNNNTTLQQREDPSVLIRSFYNLSLSSHQKMVQNTLIACWEGFATQEGCGTKNLPDASRTDVSEK